ncbi:hypothetical protein [Burkholderia multivorans]|uniref:hypothetical protein n=1 Tax=Burkholderia multivorans TaxID=87883 RepID=UPI0020B453EA|nr:hypothetical protein [Burkholderia multivorans]
MLQRSGFSVALRCHRRERHLARPRIHANTRHTAPRASTAHRPSHPRSPKYHNAHSRPPKEVRPKTQTASDSNSTQHKQIRILTTKKRIKRTGVELKKQSLCLLAATAISAFIVAGCGGGDDSSNASSGAPANTGGANNAASAPAVASTPLAAAPASAPVASSQPAMVGEALPSLTNPQAGSTAATASGPTGIWTQSGNLGYSTIALVDPNNNVSTLNLLSSFVMSNDFTSLTINGATWSLSSGFNFAGMTGIVKKIDSGSGAYSAKQTLSGTISRGGTASDFTWTYNAENALSVTQDSVTGAWATTNASFTIASGGSVTGTLSGCNMTGTLLLATPNSNQNMYDMTLTASTSSGCKLPAGVPLSGSAAIMFVPIRGSNGFQRSILYVLRAADYSFVAYGQVIKQ